MRVRLVLALALALGRGWVSQSSRARSHPTRTRTASAGSKRCSCHCHRPHLRLRRHHARGLPARVRAQVTAPAPAPAPAPARRRTTTTAHSSTHGTTRGAANHRPVCTRTALRRAPTRPCLLVRLRLRLQSHTLPVPPHLPHLRPRWASLGAARRCASPASLTAPVFCIMFLSTHAPTTRLVAVLYFSTRVYRPHPSNSLF